jgi:hypothetical protein
MAKQRFRFTKVRDETKRLLPACRNSLVARDFREVGKLRFAAGTALT